MSYGHRPRDVYYSDEEDEIDVRVGVRHGRSPSPQPVYRVRPAAAPVYYSHGNSYLVPESHGGHRRSSSFDRPRSERPTAPPVAPVIINNRIYNDYDENEIAPVDNYLVAHPHGRSRSHSHSRSRPVSYAGPTATDFELEQTRRELEEYQRKEAADKEAERMKRHMELKRLKDERDKKERDDMIEEERKRAIKEFEEKQLKKKIQDEKDKKEREAQYKIQMETDMRKAGMDETQIAIVLKKEGAPKSIQEAAPPLTYTRMHRRHLSIETLRTYHIDYEFDQDPEYILIKRWVPEHEQETLWRHTREIRERRLPIHDHHHHHSPPVVLAIEETKHKHKEPQLEWVRKKKRSPSRTIKYFAGV